MWTTKINASMENYGTRDEFNPVVTPAGNQPRDRYTLFSQARDAVNQLWGQSTEMESVLINKTAAW
jgi:hypothetical protein